MNTVYEKFISDAGQEFIFKKPDDVWIPVDESNSDYLAYLAWIEENK